MNSNLSLDFIKLENTMIISCRGTFDRINLQKLESSINIIKNQEFEEIIIDISKVDFIDEFSIEILRKYYIDITKSGLDTKYVLPVKSKIYNNFKNHAPEFCKIFFPTLKHAIDSIVDTFDPNFVIKKSNFFIGEIFELKYTFNEKRITFFTKILNLNDKYIFFLWPKNKDKYLYQLPQHSEIVFSFLTVKGVFRFSQIIAKTNFKAKTPFFIVKRPDNNKIERIQRRLFSRVNINSIMNYKVLDNNLTPFKTLYKGKCIDLSGGGLSFESEHQLEKFSYIYIYLFIPGVTIQNIIGKIIRITKKNDKINFGVKFTAIFEKDRNKVLDYINRKK